MECFLCFGIISALLAAYDVSLYTGLVALDNIVYCLSVDDYLRWFG